MSHKDLSQSEGLSKDRFHQFISQVVFETLRRPSPLIPQNKDEIMNLIQQPSMTDLQEYIYAQHGHHATKITEASFNDPSGTAR